MLPEHEEHGPLDAVDDNQPQFVGAPTEFADRDEVPEAVSLLAKILAGGVLTWTVLVAVGIILTIGCSLCAILSFSGGLLLR
jgi:hypothetical protein